MRRGLAALRVACLAWTACVVPAFAQHAGETQAERDTITGIRVSIEQRQCAQALGRLNDGLKARYPGVFLLAGALYEEGVCLKPSWERAEQMYQRAGEAGHPAAPLRLVAGLADGPRDVAAALWWAQQARSLPLPGACQVDDAARADPDRFVAALKGWPAQQVQGCLYAAAVVAMVAGYSEYPLLAAELGAVGRVEMSFWAGEGRFEFSTTDIEFRDTPGLLSGDNLRDRNTRAARRALEDSLRASAAQALKRYPRPAGVPADWLQKMAFDFTIKTRPWLLDQR